MRTGGQTGHSGGWSGGLHTAGHVSFSKGNPSLVGDAAEGSAAARW